MLTGIPIYISVIFILTTLGTIGLFTRAILYSTSTSKLTIARFFVGLSILWLILQASLSLLDRYNSDFESFPPKIFLFGILPILIAILTCFLTKKGIRFIDSLPLKQLTLISLVRVPVEFVLLWLFMNDAIPEIMTFEGRNFDILAGFFAPFIVYFGIKKNRINKPLVLTWNLISLALLINIIYYAFLSTPSPIQKFGFDQPNLAILNYPFSWLATYIVPLVLFSHFISIRRLIVKQH